MFLLKMAEQTFLINNKFEYVKKLCKNYIVNENNDENVPAIEVTKQEIIKEDPDGQGLSLAYLESLAIYRKICELVSKNETFLFHCSAIAFDGAGVLFTAPSGTGKSTHARLWTEYFKERVKVVNDDKPLIRLKDDGVYVYGTPWCGKHGIETNMSVKIKAVVVIERGKENSIEKLDFEEGYPVLFAQTYRPVSESGMQAFLRFLNRFSESVDMYRLKCNISKEAVTVAHGAIFN